MQRSGFSSTRGARIGDADIGAVEVLERARGGRSALPLVAVGVRAGAVRVLGRRREPEEAQLPDLHARPQLDRQRGDVAELEGDVPREAGVDESGGRVLVVVSNDGLEEFLEEAANKNVTAKVIGRTGGSLLEFGPSVKVPLDVLTAASFNQLPEALGQGTVSA